MAEEEVVEPIEEETVEPNLLEGQPQQIVRLVTRLSARVQDEDYPYTEQQYLDEILSVITEYNYSPDNLPPNLENLVLLKCQVNLYYDLSGKHAKNYRVRIEGDMEVHKHQPSRQYIQLAMELEKRLNDELDRKMDSIEVIEATRWRVSDNRNTPYPDGRGWYKR